MFRTTLVLTSLFVLTSCQVPGRPSSLDHDMICLAAVYETSSRATQRGEDNTENNMVGSYYIGRVEGAGGNWGKQLPRYRKHPAVTERFATTARDCFEDGTKALERGYEEMRQAEFDRLP